MKFFIDTANINEIREAEALGILDGVTTNPSLVSKEGKPLTRPLIDLPIRKRPVGKRRSRGDRKRRGMLKEGREFAKWRQERGQSKTATTREA